MSSNDDTIDTLNDLIETTKDGEYGFRACAEQAKSPELKQLLADRAAQCAEGAGELQSIVSSLGGKAEDSGTASGAMHRGWVSVRSTLSSFTDLAVLEECERGEDKALARYRSALEQPLPPEVRSIVERQSRGVQANHDLIRDRRNSLRAAA
ncbi:MAG TPA: PA2169 family four-helix-bundle protein [Methylibium sp.]|uniref:PA2169 family four-helix-bundle protein n=1 Tax=Methylibium sp. TaxID=2067992 RepID=UPI002DB85934|nr:PA2169 family four-helix-bundle protein [Methylibium sp.]HEU4459132.1 PA2169 family four-helix-bundle protein [Methylibium sp.]